jgi:hypothetical protein
MVKDTDCQDEATTFEDWLRFNCRIAPGMILFDPEAPPKVDTVPVEVR